MTARLTNRELDVMAILWDRGSATVGEVQDALDDPLAYTTVLTVLRRLELKSYVRHETEDRSHRFFPTIEPADVEGRSLRRVLDRLYQGSRELMIRRLVSQEELSRDELVRIRDIIDERLDEEELDGLSPDDGPLDEEAREDEEARGHSGMADR